MRQHIRVFVSLSASALFLISCSAETVSKAESCTVLEGADGGLSIRCPDGSEVTLPPPGEPGACTVTDNGDGSATIHCPDGTTATVANGDDGVDGRDGVDGTKASWLEGTSCFLFLDADTTEVSCLDGRSWSLDPSCTFADQPHRGLRWKVFTCPDGDAGIIEVRREAAKARKDQLAAGLYNTCFLSEAGALRCWGRADDLQMLNLPEEELLELEMGYNHSCALRPDQPPICWGSNLDQQLEVPAGETFIQIGVGLRHSCGLREDGTTRCWGRVESGDLNDPLDEAFVQIAVGEHNTCGLRADGTVRCWGSTSFERGSPPDDERFLLIDAGAGHYCGMRIDGTVGCWGLNDSAQATPPADEVFAEIDAGFRHNCGLLPDGRASCWGEQRDGRSLAPEDETFTTLVAGNFHSCGLTTGGWVICWGDDTDGQSTPPPPLGCFPSLPAPGAEPIEGLAYRGWSNFLYTELDFPGGLDSLGPPAYTGIVTSVEIPPPFLEGETTNYAVSLQGLIEFESDEDISFRLTSDDGSRLFLDDVLVVDNDGLHAATPLIGSRLCIQAGWHRVGVEYFQQVGEAALSLEMSKDGIEFVPAGPFVLEVVVALE